MWNILKYLDSILTNDGRCTCAMKCWTAMAKAAFNKKRALFNSTLAFFIMPSISVFALARISRQSPFQTPIPVFSQRTLVQSRTSFNFRNQYFTIIHHFERHNGNKFFVFGSRYRKEMALDGAGFTQK
jgi:hypothetical protein